MLRVEYSREASNYFLDNGKLTFELMVAIENLVFNNGLPVDGNHVEGEPGWHVWQFMGHLVVYQRGERRLIVHHVKPVR
jgi:hypothetical protein